MNERQRHIKEDTTEGSPASHLDVEEIGKFTTGELSAEQNQRAQKHLAHCDRCRRELAALLRLAAAEVTEAERKLLQSLPPFESSAQVPQTLARFPHLSQEDSEIFAPSPSLWERLSTLIREPVWRPAFATAVLAFLVLAAVGGYRLYVSRQIHGSLARGYEAVKEGWRVSDNDFRPVGEFDPSPLSLPHGHEPVPAAGVAVQAFESVLARDGQNREAMLGLALVASFSGRMAQADSLLQILLQRDSTDAAAWNQRGIVWARLEQHHAALAAFAAALRHRPDYHEAAFNRALLLTRLRRRTEAIASWQEYLRRDPASPWSQAAREHLRKLEQP